MMPTHGMFCIIAICKGDWLHQSWGNAASLDHIHALLGGGRGPLTAQNLAPFSAQKSRGILMPPSFAPKDESSRPHVKKKNTVTELSAVTAYIFLFKCGCNTSFLLATTTMATF